MIGRALDSNNDIMLSNGSFKTVSGSAQVVQFVRSRLLTYFGECFIDISRGVPYFEDILKKPADLANVESILKSVILGTTEVSEIVSFSMDYEGGSARKLTVTCSVLDIYNNELDIGEVTVNV